MFKKVLMFGFLALAVGMAIPTTRAEIASWSVPITDGIGERLVPRRIEVMADMLDVRLSRAEGLPDNFEGWLRRDYTSSPTDPWDNMYYLTRGRRDYTVGSMGPDGIQGNDDDISITRPMPDTRRR